MFLLILIVSIVPNEQPGNVLAWAPWVILAVQRLFDRLSFLRISAAVPVFALQFLGAAPGVSVGLLLACLIVCLLRFRPLAATPAVLVAVAVGFLLAAVQYFPMIDYRRHAPAQVQPDRLFAVFGARPAIKPATRPKGARKPATLPASAPATQPIPTPRAWVVDQAELCPSRSAALQRVQSPAAFQGQNLVLIDPLIAPETADLLTRPQWRQWWLRRGASAGRAQVQYVQDSPEKITLDLRNARNGWLVIPDPYWPGWRATLDGRRAILPVLPAYGSCQTVPLAGSSPRIILEYQPLLWRWALYATAGGGVLWLLILSLGLLKGESCPN